MDNGFPILDAFNDDQAFERHFESLLDDASNQLPDLDSGVLGDTGTHGVSHTVDGLDALGQDLFDSPSLVSNSNLPHGSYSLPSPGGPMLTSHKHHNQSYGPGSVGSQPPPSPAHSVPQSPMGGHTPSVPPSPYAHPMQSPASVPPPPSPAQHHFSVPSPAQPMSPVTHLQMKSPAPLPPPQSPANILYAKSPAPHMPPQSPSNQNLRCSTTPGPPVLSPQPMPAPQTQTTNPIFLNAPSPSGPIFSGPSLVSGTVLTSNQLGMQPIQLHPSGNLVSGAQPMFQFQIQPNVSMQSLATSSQSTKIQPVASQTIPITPNKGKQPQLLPKPSGSISNSPQSVAPRPKPGGPVTSAMTMTSPSTSNQQQQPLIINQNGLISNVQQSQGQVFMGQMMTPGGAGTAPLLIQQPQGNMMILRPGAPTMQSMQAAPTLVPIQNGMGGQIFVQQAPQQTGIMPNVKLITPQGRMQMQHIQTPQGPKLIAVPIGQTLIQGPNGQILTQGQNIITNNSSGGMQINANGQIQFQAAPNMALSSAPMFSTTSQGYTLQATMASCQPQIIYSSPSFVSSSSTSSTGGVTTVMSSLQPINSLNSMNNSNLITSQSVIQPNKSLDTTTTHPAMQMPVSPTKKKKSKKKKKDEDPPAQSTPQVQSQKAVDLGALMKDVGLDFGDDFGFGVDQSSNSNNLNESSQNLNNSLNSSIGSSSSDLENDIGNISIPAPPVIQPPEQVPVSVPQISFAQIPQPQFQAPQLATSQIGTQQIVSNTPLQGMRLANPIISPQVAPQINSNTAAQSLQLVQGPDGNFILQTNPSQGILGGQPVEVNTGSAANTAAATQNPQQNTTTTAITSQAQKSSPRAPARSRTAADPNRTPLFEDETLPSGWHRKVSQRKSGASAGRYEVFIIGPTGKRFRSRNELKSFFEKTHETQLNPDDFDFSTFGRNNPKGTGPAVVQTASSTVVSQSNQHRQATAAASVIVTTTPSVVQSMPSVLQNTTPISTASALMGSMGSSSSLSESELIKNLENSAMASVAAARALETGTQGLPPRNSLLQNIQQPLPQSSLSGNGMNSASSLNLPQHPPTLPQQPLAPIPQQIRQSNAPPQPLLMPPSNSQLVKQQPPTPLSADMEDAESQISQLLESLQKQQGPSVKNEPDKMSEFFDSIAGPKTTGQPMPQAIGRIRSQSGSISMSPEPPVITTTTKTSETFTKPPRFFNENVGSPSMPVLTPQVPISEHNRQPHDTSFQNKYLDNLARTQISDKRSRSRNESGPLINSPNGMPLLSPTTGIMHSPHAPDQSASPRPNAIVQNHLSKANASSGVIQQVPRSESQAQNTNVGPGGPPNVTVQSSAQGASGSGMGGPGSQLRALQHLPPNTRLHQGPNGQPMIQRIQTIELSQQMQQQYKILAQKIANIEQRPLKTPKDEADLAELQAKQHQILSTGRPVFGQQQNAVINPPAQPNISGPHPSTLPTVMPKNQTLSVKYPHQEIPNISQTSQLAPNHLQQLNQNVPGQIRPGTGTGVPPLTDHQKKIVAEFKAKIAKFPPQEQSAFIAQNKVNLIKQLNFQPNQLRILQNGQPQPPVQIRPPQLLQPHPTSDPLRPVQPVIIGCQVVQPNSMPQILPVTVNPTPHMPQTLPNPIPVEILPEPIPVRRPSMPPIDKTKKIAWVESQIKNDQQEAVNPKYRTPFRGREDACKRLLRYHVFDESTMDVNDLVKADLDFDKKSETLLSRYHSNLSKYHCLLLDESIRLCSSSSEAMLGRMWVADERAALAREKEEFRQVCSKLDELSSKESLTCEEKLEQSKLLVAVEPDFPPFPDSWASKYEQVTGKSWDAYKQKNRKKSSHSYNADSHSIDSDEEPPIEIKREPEIVVKKEIEMFDDHLEMGNRMRHQSNPNPGDLFSGNRSRNSSGAMSKKELRVSLTNVMDHPQVKRDLAESGSVISSSSRPHSAADLTSPDQNGSFVGLKFNRTMSGRWSASLKRDVPEDDNGEYNIMQMSKRMREAHPMSKTESQGSLSDDSEDEEFSLADVGGNNAAVRSMLENDDDMDDDEMQDELRFDNQSRTSFDHFDPSHMRLNGAFNSPSLGSEPRDTDSVQNAINSILDLHDRGGVQTPDDLKNLTGLLDSMESDPTRQSTQSYGQSDL